MITRRTARRGGALIAAAPLAALALAGCVSDAGSPAGTSAGPVASAPAQQAADLTPAQFAAAIEQAGTVLLDVRTPQEFAEGHLAGAVNIDLQSAEFASRIAELDPAGRYAVYCRTGRRSAAALEQMRAAGFANVQHLAGGIVAWAGDGREVVTG